MFTTTNTHTHVVWICSSRTFICSLAGCGILECCLHQQNNLLKINKIKYTYILYNNIYYTPSRTNTPHPHQFIENISHSCGFYIIRNVNESAQRTLFSPDENGLSFLIKLPSVHVICLSILKNMFLLCCPENGLGAWVQMQAKSKGNARRRLLNSFLFCGLLHTHTHK